jgi:hypothetical protein
MLSAALGLRISCWHPLIVNCSSTLFPGSYSTARSIVEKMELITFQANVPPIVGVVGLAFYLL